MRRMVASGVAALAAIVLWTQAVAAPAKTNPAQCTFTAADGGVARSCAQAFADRGVLVSEFPGATAGAQIQAAHDSLPGTGGVIHAEMLVGAQTISSTIALSKPVTILFGGATFTSSVAPIFTWSTDDIKFQGIGQNNATIFMANVASASLFRSANTAVRRYRIVFRDLAVDDTSSANAGSVGIDFTNISEGELTNVLIQNAATCFVLAGSAGSFYNILTHVNASSCVLGYSISGLSNENWFYFTRANSVTNGYSIDNVSNVSFVTPNVETFSGTGFNVAPTNVTQYTKIIGPRCENSGGVGTCVNINANAQATVVVGPACISMATCLADAASNGDTTIIYDSFASPRLFANKLLLGSGATKNSMVYSSSSALVVFRNSVDSAYADLDAKTLTTRATTGTAPFSVASTTPVPNLVAFATGRTTPTYGTTITINASLGGEFVIQPTDGVAFTVSNPTNPPSTGGQRITVRIKNAFGVLGAVTMGGQYKFTGAAAFPAVANGFSRAIEFQYDGTNWIEAARTPADVPN